MTKMTSFDIKVIPFTLLLSFLVWTTAAEDYICQLCGGGGSVNPGGIIDIPGSDGEQTTCAALWLAAQDGLFNETYCVDVVQPFVKEPCGCLDPDIPPYICQICAGGESTNPGGIIDVGELGQTTCAAVYTVAQEGAFNETFCSEIIQPISKEPCGCTDPPTAAPGSSSPGSEGPGTSAPTETPSESAASTLTSWFGVKSTVYTLLIGYSVLSLFS